MDQYQTLNETLVVLFNQILNIEERALITDEFSDISVNDMHIIEAIGIEKMRNMSTVAKTMDVTTGTLTIAVNSLVKKGYVLRNRSESDKRVIYLVLTPKGIHAYEHHKNFHDHFIHGVMQQVDVKELNVLIRALDGLNSYFKSIR